uniref:histidine kinase n=1 Tax=Planktothricoides sp. SpSt-374 TaxID=2282167 RepID=A0A7C3VGZ3_9CYAN
MIALSDALNLDKIASARKISAAVVNISGRQRMLSQRMAFLAMRLVGAANVEERVTMRDALLETAALMEKSHWGLIQGSAEMNLPGKPSGVVREMYFQAPLHLDVQVRRYIEAARALAREPEVAMTQNNRHLQYIIEKAAFELLAGLDAVVSQYQLESEAEQDAVDANLAKLYQQSREAASAAAERAKQVEITLQDLQQAQQLLIQGEKLSNLGLMVAELVHEIKNPVNFIYGNVSHIRGYTEDLLSSLRLYQECYPHPHPKLEQHLATVELDFLLEDLPKILDSMQVGAENLRELVLSLKDFSRMDSGAMKPVAIHEGLDNILLILQHRLKGKGGMGAIEVVKEYGELPLVECYQSQVNQVFMNVLSNAIEALEEMQSKGEGGQRPKITIRTEMLNSDFIAVRIADNGPGMTEKVRQQLFAPFFTTKAAGKGTGLGLSISFQIVVQKHRGFLWCVSEPGEGTEFWIKLPVLQRAKSPTRTLAVSEEATAV